MSRDDDEPGPTLAGAGPADFLMLDQNPLEFAQNLRHIAIVIRHGKIVVRERLLPDLTRRDYGSE